MVTYKHYRMNNERQILFTNRNITEYVYSAEGEKLHTIHCKAVNNMAVPIEHPFGG